MKKNIYVIIASVLFSIILWVSVSLSLDFYYTINIPIKIINYPDGYISGTDLPERVSIKLKGKGWNLILISLKSDLKYFVASGNNPGQRTVYLQNSIYENSWINSDIQVVSFKPESINFNIEKIGQKEVKIVPDVNLTFKENYGLASPVKIYPESTIVYGPRSYLKNLKEVYTEKITYSKLDQKISDKFKLKELDGFFFSNNVVMVNIDVQQIVEKSFDNVFIDVKNVPKGEEVILIPNKISVSLRGGINVLGKTTSEDIKPFVTYEDIIRDTNEMITPNIKLAPDVNLLFLKPNEIKFIIKKF